VRFWSFKRLLADDVVVNRFGLAFKLLREAVEHGEVSAAAFQLGLLYFNGDGVDEDRNTAAKHFQSAALATSSAEAMYMAGIAYLGMKGKEKKARRWLQLAATAHHAPASYRLGMAYLVGELLLERNVEKAEDLLGKARETVTEARLYFEEGKCSFLNFLLFSQSSLNCILNISLFCSQGRRRRWRDCGRMRRPRKGVLRAERVPRKCCGVETAKYVCTVVLNVRRYRFFVRVL
jgi:hypothetical protein